MAETDDVNERFSASCVRLRMERGWSQERLAEIAGVATATVQNCEQRRNGITLNSADALATALGTTVDGMTGRLVPEVVTSG